MSKFLKFFCILIAVVVLGGIAYIMTLDTKAPEILIEKEISSDRFNTQQ